MRATGDTTFRVEGVVRLAVKIGGHKKATGFVVAPKLATKRTLETAFIDKETKKSWGKRRPADKSIHKVFMQSQSSKVLRPRTPYSHWAAPRRMMTVHPSRTNQREAWEMRRQFLHEVMPQCWLAQCKEARSRLITYQTCPTKTVQEWWWI